MSVVLADIDVETNRLLADTCRKSFWRFVKTFWSSVPGANPLVENWHMIELCRTLQEAAERVFLGLPKKHDIVINISPSTSKSTICSILFHPWTWTRMPNMRHLSASHASELVLDLATKSRTVITGHLYRTLFPGIELADDQDTKGYYRNTLGGDRLTCTVSGVSPMGFHSHWQCIDDPIDPKKARSEAEKITAKEFMTDVLPSRKIDKAVTVMVLVMQRLGVGDPTDVVLDSAKAEGSSLIKRLCLPSELTDDVEPVEFRRYYEEAGGLFDAKRLPKQILDVEKARSIYAYTTQYLQKAHLPGGGMFQDIWMNDRVKSAPYKAKRVFYIDRACLVAGTMVATSDGEVAIERVRAGDMVLTRQGYKRVKRAWLTKYTERIMAVWFANGSLLVGTPDHRVWTENRGWVDLASISSSDYAVCLAREDDTWQSVDGKCSQTPTGSSSRGFVTRGVRAGGTITLCGGTRCGSGTGLTPCTVPSGDIIGEISRPGMTCITPTRMWTTTTSAIWSASRGLNTTEGTIRSLSGTRHLKPMRTAVRLFANGGSRLLTASTTASIAALASVPGESTNPLCTALVNAGKGIGWGSSRESVPCVTACSMDAQVRIAVPRRVMASTGQQTARVVGCDSRKRDSSRSPVRRPAARSCTGPVAVYDLEVEDAHEFFANGVLVHNSTADGGCYTAGVLMAKCPEGNYYVEDVLHGQWEPDIRNQKIKAACLRYRRKYGPKQEPKIYVEAEGGSSGRDAWKGVVRALAGFRVREDKVTGSKDRRAEPWASQLAANNVKLVDNGESGGQGRSEWDVGGYVLEHVRFKPDPKVKRLGGIVDRVDASSGAFNVLVGLSSGGTVIRRFDFGGKKGPPIRVLVCTEEELPAAVIDRPTAMIHMGDPMTGEDDSLPLPEHALGKLVGCVSLRFADVDPAEVMDAWREEMPGMGMTPEQAALTREQCRRVWGFLFRKHDPPIECVVFVEQEESRRATSMAYAFVDVMGYKRREVMLSLRDNDNSHDGQPPNQYVYDMTRVSRSGMS